MKNLIQKNSEIFALCFTQNSIYLLNSNFCTYRNRSTSPGIAKKAILEAVFGTNRGMVTFTSEAIIVFLEAYSSFNARTIGSQTRILPKAPRANVRGF